MLCSCEDKQEESEEHLLSEARYMDIFSGDIDEQLILTKIFQKVLNDKKTLMNMKLYE